MTAVARLLPPRPTPKSVPPPALAESESHTQQIDLADVVVVSEQKVRSLPPPAPVLAGKMASSSGAHPGVVLLRTIGFFVVEIVADGLRTIRAYTKAHWVRASARARARK